MSFGNIKFYYENWWDDAVVTASTEHVNWPATNTQKRWKTETWRSQNGNNSGWGRFIIDSTNKWLYFTEDGDCLLLDPGLEQWTTATNLTQWTENVDATCSIDREAVEVHSGTYSCKMTQGGGVGQNVSILQPFTMTSTGDHRLTVWYKNNTAGKTLVLYVLDSGNNVWLKEDATWNVGAYFIVLPNSLTWTSYTIDFTKHVTYANYKIAVLASSGQHFNDFSYIDDISIYPYPARDVAIAEGTYDADSLADAIELAMDTSGTWDYEVIYNDTTNKFEIYAVDSGTPTFQLNCTETTNSIWNTIGFATNVDTDFATFHIGDYMRIHTSECIKGFYEDMIFDAVHLFGHNLQSTATVIVQISNDDFVTYSEVEMARGSHNNYHAVLTAETTRSYVRICIEDIDNPDGFIEVGRIWVSRVFKPSIGFSPKWNWKPNDPSLVKYSEGGQISSIQRTHFKTWGISFEHVKEAERDYFNSLFGVRGTSREFVVTFKPLNPATLEFENPEDNTYYVHFKKYNWKVNNGVNILSTSLEEER